MEARPLTTTVRFNARPAHLVTWYWVCSPPGYCYAYWLRYARRRRRHGLGHQRRCRAASAMPGTSSPGLSVAATASRPPRPCRPAAARRRHGPAGNGQRPMPSFGARPQCQRHGNAAAGAASRAAAAGTPCRRRTRQLNQQTVNPPSALPAVRLSVVRPHRPTGAPTNHRP
jgi:hypothetical protein